jgi:hypothetical protein
MFRDFPKSKKIIFVLAIAFILAATLVYLFSLTQNKKISPPGDADLSKSTPRAQAGTLTAEEVDSVLSGNSLKEGPENVSENKNTASGQAESISPDEVDSVLGGGKSAQMGKPAGEKNNSIKSEEVDSILRGK